MRTTNNQGDRTMSKLITAEDIKKIIEQYNNEEKSDNLLFEEIKKALKPFIGKPINKRLETALKKHFGDDYFIYLERIGSVVNLKVKGNWKDQSEYRKENGHSFHLGYSDNLTYEEGDSKEKFSGFNYFSISYGDASLERIERNKKLLRSPKKLEKLADAINKYHEALKVLNDSEFSSYHFPARYLVDKAFNLNIKRY